MINEEVYLEMNLKQLELEQENLNYKLYRLDQTLNSLKDKYDKLKADLDKQFEDEQFYTVQDFQETCINLESVELEIENLKKELGIEDSDEDEPDSKQEEIPFENESDESSSTLDVTNNIINKLKTGE